MTMTTSDTGLAFMRGWEALRTHPYLPTPRDRPTIGYGMTHYPSGIAVTLHDAAITPDQAASLFAVLVRQVEAQVRPLIHVPVTQAQWDALISLAYNIGAAHFAASRVVRALNKGDRAGAADAFLLWDEQAHTVLPGLDARRKAERALFLSVAAVTS